MDLLDRLLGHDVWSTRQLLLQSQNLSDVQLDQVFDIDSRTLRGCFLHMIENMEVWNDLLYQRPPQSDDVREARPRSVEGLLARLAEAGRELAALARGIARQNRWDDVFLDVLDNPP